MIRICPNPQEWHKVHLSLLGFAESHLCEPEKPPVPLILGGWAGSNDREKRIRWEQTMAWAHANGCTQFLEILADEDFYVVTEKTSYVVGPMGGPMYRDWDFTPKLHPTDDMLGQHLRALKVSWTEGPEPVWHHTAPLEFTGAKARKLTVAADPEFSPPWGTWDSRYPSATARATFTAFRSRVNSLLDGHEVDHVEFVTSVWPITEEHKPDQL